MNNTINPGVLCANNLSSRKLWQLLECAQAARLSHSDIQAIEAELAKRKQLNRRWQQPH